ncbi:hypothetical protein [Lentzea sp. NBRC 102530]|uniref:hypothetical protein n=1 Tax=Lentzea sp. NBRC 102530 TaxID=3032201 RepID=UPI0024A15078|nr:hypothetical protein [Lentzea sp. NBRC 102530]GLY52396.1 hypothetical protein Lesp01_60520 [Lentzea sp. NBRC 102530]
MDDGFLPEPNDRREYRSPEEESDRNDLIAIIAIVVGALVLILCIPFAPKALKVAFAAGPAGTYVVGDLPECSSTRCYTRTGTFTSDDGTVKRTGVHVRSGMPLGLKKGDTIRAFDIGAPGEVFTDQGQNGYPAGVPLIGGLLALGAAGFGIQHLWATRRRPQSE